jgi:para-nitrobenzyl esterase
LYLNVFSRAKRSDAKLPVLVWIHGGAFNFGSGSGLLYGPERAMDLEIVLVIISITSILLRTQH